MTAPFECSLGPRDARIAFVGEAWGEEEAKLRKPFIGSSGQELTRMMLDAGIKRSDVFLTNVFALRPANNDILTLTVGRKLATNTLPPLQKGKFLSDAYLGEVERLSAELSVVRPNLVVALGNTACWALLGSSGISSLRGTTASATLEGVEGLKVLPTYHPSAVLRAWNLRPITVVDLMKAKRESAFPEIRRPARKALIDPTLKELQDFFFDPLTYCVNPPAGGYYSVDIETRARQITMIGFADATDRSVVVPFVDERNADYSYWATPDTERMAWRMVQEVLESPYPKLFQNGLYDLQYIARMGIRPQNCTADTMLLHHSLYPELQKSLGFMGSVHTNEPAWKLMRRRHGASDEPTKKDE